MLEFGDWKHKTEILVDAGREGRWQPKIPISWTASSVEIEKEYLHIVVMEANLLRSDVFIGQASISHWWFRKSKVCLPVHHIAAMV